MVANFLVFEISKTLKIFLRKYKMNLIKCMKEVIHRIFVIQAIGIIDVSKFSNLAPTRTSDPYLSLEQEPAKVCIIHTSFEEGDSCGLTLWGA